MTSEAHVRIDEGIKRGPRGKRIKTRSGLPTKPSDPRDLGSWTIPTDLDPDRVLDQYLAADTTGDIAGSFGLSRKALVKWLRTVRPKEWKEVQLIRAHVKLDDGEDRLVDPADALSLASAREMVKAAQFRLTALDPDYHPKQEIQHTLVVPVLSITVVSAQHAAPLLPSTEPLLIEHDKPGDVST